ncbi:MAG: tetratricopeptide repeat protein [bacterium]|nr:tetratricopeptide repeat protein [bacterium]
MADGVFGWDDEFDALLDGAKNRKQKIELEQGERRKVAILFLDIQGFTKLSQRLDPEEARRIADTALRVFTGIIKQFSGRVDKFLGDGLMALFGSERASEHDIEHALLTGLECIRQLQEVNARLATRNLPDLSIRIGVNYGEVVVGTIASESGSETAMGAMVNLAQRMESNAPTNRILVPVAVLAKTHGRFQVSEPRTITVKGFDQSIAVVEVSGLQPAHGLEQASIPMVDRFSEVARLSEWLKDLPHPIFVTGPAGIGKSRLISEVLANYSRKIVVIRPPAAIPISYGLIGAFLRRLLSLSPDSIDLIQLKAALEQFAIDNDSVVERLGVLLGIRGAGSSLRSLSSEALFRELVAALRLLFERLPQQETVWVFEEGQWYDDISLRLLSEAGDAITAPIWREMVMRDLNEGVLPDRFRQLDQIHLSPLSEREAELLITTQYPGLELPERVMNLWRDRAAGSPLLLLELGRFLETQGHLIKSENGSWRLSGWIEEFGLPESLSALFRSRLDTLKPNEKQWVQLASVEGAGFRRAIVERMGEVLEFPPPPWESLITSGWFHPFEDDFGRFKTPLAQEAAYTALLKSNRDALHRVAAESYQMLYAERVDEFAPMLARHWLGANEPENAIDALIRWRKYAIFRYDSSSTLTAAQKTIELLEQYPISNAKRIKLDCLLDEAKIRRIHADFQRAEPKLVEALALLDPTTDSLDYAKTMMEFAYLWYDQGKIPASFESLQKAYEQCPKDTEEARECELRMADNLRMLGRAKEGLEIIQKCHDLLTEESSDIFRARAHLVLGALYQVSGLIEQAEDAYLESMEVSERVGDRLNYAIVCSSLAHFYTIHKEHEKAIRLLSDTIATLDRIGDKVRAIRARNSLSGVYVMQRKFAEAEELLLQCTLQAKLINNGVLEQAIRTNLGILAGMQGKLEEAETQFRECVTICEKFGAVDPLQSGMINLMQITSMRGLWQEVVEGASELRRLAVQAGNRSSEIDAILFLSVAHLYLKQPETALELTSAIQKEEQSPRYGIILSVLALAATLLKQSDAMVKRKTAREHRIEDDETGWLLRYQAALLAGESVDDDPMTAGPLVAERAALIYAEITGDSVSLPAAMESFQKAGATGYVSRCVELLKGNS